MYTNCLFGEGAELDIKLAAFNWFKRFCGKLIELFWLLLLLFIFKFKSPEFGGVIWPLAKFKPLLLAVKRLLPRWLLLMLLLFVDVEDEDDDDTNANAA